MPRAFVFYLLTLALSQLEADALHHFVDFVTAQNISTSIASTTEAQPSTTAGRSSEPQAMQALQAFSNNPVCSQHRCVNPIFPGMDGMKELESSEQLICKPLKEVHEMFEFCKDGVDHDVALPAPTGNQTVNDTLRDLEAKVVTQYFYHLTAIGFEPLDHRQPWNSDDDCIKATWQLLCDTYFPRAEAGCKKGSASRYLRPCNNVCRSYVQACAVTCCDESVSCTFEGQERQANGSAVLASRYAHGDGPSRSCTGSGASRAGSAVLALLLASLTCLRTGPGSSPFRLPLLLLLFIAAAQGSPREPLAGWESKSSYLLKFQYVPHAYVKANASEKAESSGIATMRAVTNGCSIQLKPGEQCSGHGTCQKWNATSAYAVPLLLCKCDRDWADPECRTRRKSQTTAFFLALFGGYLGLDSFYLGRYHEGFLKMSSLGGLGCWWFYDIVRIGSTPVYTAGYRLAADLPHWEFFTVAVCSSMLLGYFLFGVWGEFLHRRQLNAEMLLKDEQQFRKQRAQAAKLNEWENLGRPVISRHSVPLPVSPNMKDYGAMSLHPSDEVLRLSSGNPFAACAIYSRAFADGRYQEAAQVDRNLMRFGKGG